MRTPKLQVKPLDGIMNEAVKQRIQTTVAQMKYGWCHVDKAVAMGELIFEVKPKLCVEIGVYGGMSLIPCAIAIEECGSNGHIVGIDPWTNEAAAEGDSDAANKNWWSNTDLLSARASAEGAIHAFKLNRTCAIIPARSEDVAYLFPFKGIDILHIDGNHTELASVRDVQNWRPRMRQGGYVWFDDFNWATTAKAIALMDTFCDRVRDVVIQDSGGERAVRLYRVR